jgi:uncharacterized membrane protein
MDLQAAYRMGRKRWSLAKLAALICFITACGLLIGSLTGAPMAKTLVQNWQTTASR